MPKKRTCYSRILKSHPSSDCNFSVLPPMRPASFPSFEI
ncbi:hypothetical protein F383_22540 [Gossypium arboreum]|uniref:Uncharacterized protein n=1 Tax=Gossypium arboreum TaxID=29729 RepID=A0A0B0P1K6_GOSAR|nr:hypothetical protein F383_22540 [Gossypium arboreum]